MSVSLIICLVNQKSSHPDDREERRELDLYSGGHD